MPTLVLSNVICFSFLESPFYTSRIRMLVEQQEPGAPGFQTSWDSIPNCHLNADFVIWVRRKGDT